MDRLEKAWTGFKGGTSARSAGRHRIRALPAMALSAWIYSEGLHDAAELLGIVSSIGLFFAIGGWYILRGAFLALIWWLRRF